MPEPTESQASDANARELPTQFRAPGEAAGQSIGPYKLLEEIGEGGMGSVWMAQQSEPVKRRVALKIIKLGMDTKEVVARFEVERQALALMDHAHISKVLDAGVTASGRPYFVMELVRGVPITSYCDQAKFGLQERLELFSKVCHAIQHAHHKGIIHRDVKPSNILVSLQDGLSVPKVIDFGIAKATGAQLTESTLHTQYGQIVGTPEYMAPEQTATSGLDIDTRADVYALGALLYELLTGTKPLELGQAMSTGYEGLLRTIREADPAKPSTRIASLGESASPMARKRQLEAGILSKRLRGDLDWIVMKALAKERARRYETASAFAADIERYLNHEPILAAPPSASYRLRKLLRRRRKSVASVASICVLLIAGSVGTGIGWWKTKLANRSLDIALVEKAAAFKEEETQRLLAEDNEQRARSAEAQARAEAERATRAEADTKARAEELEQVASFQAEQLAGLDVERMGTRLRAALLEALPEQERADWSRKIAAVNFTSLALGSLRDNLFERTVDAIDSQFIEQPDVQARLLQTTAKTMQGLGLFEMASDPLQRALALREQKLGEQHPLTMVSRALLGALLHDQGKLEEAEAYYRADLDFCRRVHGDEHIDTLDALNNLGNLLLDQGKPSEAQPYYRESMQTRRRVFGSLDEDTLTSINNMGEVEKQLAKPKVAEAYYREALAGWRSVLGDGHRKTLSGLNNLALLLSDEGRLSEAEAVYGEALAGYRQLLGDEHPDTLVLINNLGSMLYSQGRFSEAEAHTREALEARRRLLGDEHFATLNSVKNLASICKAMGDYAKAEPLYWEAFHSFRRVLGDEHPYSRLSTKDLGTFLAERLTRARSSGEELSLGVALLALGDFQVQVGRHQEAEQVLIEALDLLSAASPEADPRPWQAQAILAAACAGQGRYGEAESMLLEAAQALQAEVATASSGEPELAAVDQVLQQVTEFYAAWHQSQPGKGHDAKAAKWQAKLSDWTALQTKVDHE